MPTAVDAGKSGRDGVVGVSTCAVAFLEAPFGGTKQSGYGREGGDSAIYEHLNTKFVHTRLTA